MSLIAITDYFDVPSAEEKFILGELVSTKPTSDTEVLMVWHDLIDEAYVAAFPKLRGVQRYGVGYDNLDLQYLKSKGILCANNPDYGVDEVSDTALAFVMNISRGVTRYNALAKKLFSDWQENVLTDIRRNRDITVGVIGAGRIGSSLLLKCNAIGFDTVFYDPYKECGHEKVVKARRVWELDELLNASDIVSIHCPLNDETRGMVDESFLSAMRPNSALINTARGGIVEQTDILFSALKSGQLSSLALDVLPHEPPEEDSLITAWRNNEPWLEGRLLVTPHTSYYSREAQLDMRVSAANNALRMYQMEQPLNLL